MKSALLFIAFGLILQVHARSFRRSDVTVEEQACLTELNLDASSVLPYFSSDDFPEDDMDFHNFFGCYSRKTGILNLRGEIDYDVVRRLFLHAARRDNQPDHVFYVVYKHVLGVAIEKCRNTPFLGVTYGEVVTKTFNCIFRKMRQAVDLPQ